MRTDLIFFRTMGRRRDDFEISVLRGPALCSCSLVDRYRRFGVAFCPSFQGTVPKDRAVEEYRIF
jgi:hypothetical protein